MGYYDDNYDDRFVRNLSGTLVLYAASLVAMDADILDTIYAANPDASAQDVHTAYELAYKARYGHVWHRSTKTLQPCHVDISQTLII